ncbi:armadillo-type protein [Spinellus fusiger]|nr:armadillo-type protein [Spinellus fusiger]
MADLDFELPNEQDTTHSSAFEEQPPPLLVSMPNSAPDPPNSSVSADNLPPESVDCSLYAQDTNPYPTQREFPDTAEPSTLSTATAASETHPHVMANDVSTEEQQEAWVMDDILSPMERIYLLNKSDAVIHRQLRLLVAKELAHALPDISLTEAVEGVLPMALGIGTDTDDTVRETFASELDKIILYYYQNAPPLHLDASHSTATRTASPPPSTSLAHLHLYDTTTSDEPTLTPPMSPLSPRMAGTQVLLDSAQEQDIASDREEQAAAYPHIPPHTFTSLLIGFLLDQNSNLASIAQQCIVYVASELVMATGPNKDLYQYLLETEISQGIMMGLMSIAQAEDIDQGEINLAKKMCLSLISALANIFGPEHCKSHCLPIVEQLASDQMFYVRKEAAAAIGSLASVVDVQVAVDQLLPLYMTFSNDTIWHVRRSCVFTLPLLCSVLPSDIRSRVAIEAVDSFRNDSSRNVRNTIAEIIGELIARFLPKEWETSRQPGHVPEPLLDFFLSLGVGANPNQMFKLETDRAILCAYNFPAVLLTAGADYWDSHLKETYLSLSKDYQIKVRRTFAYSLHEISRIIGSERTERDLVQIFALYLMDLDDVKQGVLEHLAEFLSTLAVSSRNEYIPILAEVWDGVMTNWRLRDILAGQLRDIAMLFDAARVVEHVLPLVVRACCDEYAIVRATGVNTFPVILEMVKQSVDENGENLSQDDNEERDTPESRRIYALALLSHVMEKLEDFIHSDMYRSRLVFAQICSALLETGLFSDIFAAFFLPRLAPLAKDPVVNVRIATARAIQAICLNDVYVEEREEDELDEASIERSHHRVLLRQTVHVLSVDSDVDVQSFVLYLVHPHIEKEEEDEEEEEEEEEEDEERGHVQKEEEKEIEERKEKEIEDCTDINRQKQTTIESNETEDSTTETQEAEYSDQETEYSEDEMGCSPIPVLETEEDSNEAPEEHLDSLHRGDVLETSHREDRLEISQQSITIEEQVKEEQEEEDDTLMQGIEDFPIHVDIVFKDIPASDPEAMEEDIRVDTPMDYSASEEEEVEEEDEGEKERQEDGDGDATMTDATEGCDRTLSLNTTTALIEKDIHYVHGSKQIDLFEKVSQAPSHVSPSKESS